MAGSLEYHFPTRTLQWFQCTGYLRSPVAIGKTGHIVMKLEQRTALKTKTTKYALSPWSFGGFFRHPFRSGFRTPGLRMGPPSSWHSNGCRLVQRETKEKHTPFWGLPILSYPHRSTTQPIPFCSGLRGFVGLEENGVGACPVPPWWVDKSQL